ncbi:MAG: 4Fe-4S binding protein [Candidatus Cloacimonetes bacterium]|nr:4Fe-4S binding protein [Candidatus Cloacimonadota bacterium]
MKHHSKAPALQIVRVLIQSFFLILAALALYFVISGKLLSIHHLCPYSIVCFGLNGAGFIRITEAIFATSIVAGFAILILSLFWGRFFCGYVCPLGSAQEALFSFHGKRYRVVARIPQYLERKFIYIKYIVLLVNAVMVLSGIAYLYLNHCPLVLLSKAPFWGMRGLIMLSFILLGSIFLERFWCRFLCPYAALLNLSQYLGRLFKIKRKMIRRNLERCTDCGICTDNCPMNINLLEKEVVDDPNCIHCHICDRVCPKKPVISSTWEHVER